MTSVRPAAFVLLFAALGCSSPDSAPCTSSRQCAAGALVCDRAAGRCVECLSDVDCLGEGELCLGQSCVLPVSCVSSRECPGQVCDPLRAFCVDCVSDLDCVADHTCRQSVCVPRAPSPPVVLDAGSPRDAGRIADAGQGADAGELGPDAGTGAIDAGPRPIDAGPRPIDAGPRPIDAGPRLDAGRDAGPTDPPDAGSAGLCAPTASAIHISELMVATAPGEFDRGEWFELYNSGGCDVDLTGLVIESPTNQGNPRTFTMTSGSITAGDVAVFAQSAVFSENHGVPHDYVYGNGSEGVILSNARDTLSVRLGGQVLSSVSWDSLIPIGFAMQRDETDRAPVASIEAWPFCEAPFSYSIHTATGQELYGGPGNVNFGCTP